MNFKILRLFNVYGGNNFLIKNSGVISEWIKCYLNNKPLIIDNKGRCVRDFIYINDIIKIIENLLFINKKGVSIYNIGSGKNFPNSLLKILRKTFKKKQKKISLKLKIEI